MSSPPIHPTAPSQRLQVPPALNHLVTQVIECALEVHRAMGPGLLEAVYEECLSMELHAHAVPVQRQHPVEIYYRGHRLESGYRADLLVGPPGSPRLLVELKSSDGILPIHRAQVITYLRILDLPLGLLLNFNSTLLRDGLERILNARWKGGKQPGE